MQSLKWTNTLWANIILDHLQSKGLGLQLQHNFSTERMNTQKSASVARAKDA